MNISFFPFSNLKEVIEGWILLSIKKGLPIPALGKNEIKELQEGQEFNLVA
jgi:hypothetical protein